MGDHKFKNDRPVLTGKTVGGDIRGEEHFDKIHNRPDLEPTNKRPMIDASSHSGPGEKQKVVRTTVGESEVVIARHCNDGWSYYNSIPQGGNEILLIFKR